jgi:C-terminal processing protease CtpA/Prc
MRAISAVGWLGIGLAVPALAPRAGAQGLGALDTEALAAYDARNYQRCAELYAQLVERILDDPEKPYQAGRCFAHLGKKAEAFDQFNRAVDRGFLDADHLLKDDELAPLHADARWAPLVERTRALARRHDRMWKNPVFKTPYRENLGEDEKVAGLSRLWSEAKFNFAYFDKVPDLDWDALYLQYLPKVRQSPSTLAYYRLLKELYARLHDGHTNVYLPGELRPAMYSEPLVRTRLIEDKVLIRRVDDPRLAADGAAPGLEVVAVDGQPARAYGEEKVAPFVSASTPQDRASRTYDDQFLSGAAGTSVELTLRDAAGRTFKRTLPRIEPEARWKNVPSHLAMELRMLPGNVALVALNTFESNEASDRYLAAFPEIAKADAIIFDLRENGGGNGNVGFRILATLTDKPFPLTQWRTRLYRPAYRAWGAGEVLVGHSDATRPPDGKRLYKGPVAVLASVRTFSAGEDFTAVFQTMKRGLVVGEPTGGSTGQPLFFDLPGGGRARVCTKRDSFPDGREFVGVGIQPDKIVRSTIADFRAGRDPVLDAALRALKKKS